MEDQTEEIWERNELSVRLRSVEREQASIRHGKNNHVLGFLGFPSVSRKFWKSLVDDRYTVFSDLCFFSFVSEFSGTELKPSVGFRNPSSSLIRSVLLLPKKLNRECLDSWSMLSFSPTRLSSLEAVREAYSRPSLRVYFVLDPADRADPSGRWLITVPWDHSSWSLGTECVSKPNRMKARLRQLHTATLNTTSPTVRNRTIVEACPGLRKIRREMSPKRPPQDRPKLEVGVRL